MMPPVAGLAALCARYGDARRFYEQKEAWERQVLVTVPLSLPVPYAYGPDPVRRIRAHRLVAHDLAAILTECVGAGLPLLYGGCYCYRPKRAVGELSTHAWGIAVDLNPAENPLGRAWVDDGTMLHRDIIACFRAHGWAWGGEWARPDAMHFQAATGY